MTSVKGMVGHQTAMQEMSGRRRSMVEDGSLVLCNLPPRASVSDWEPSRMSYYNGDELLSVPFKWEAAPGKPIVDESSQTDTSGELPVLQLRPPPSASNSPLHAYVPPSLRDQHKGRLPPKSRSYSRPEITTSSASRRGSSSVAPVADSSRAGHLRARSKGSLSKPSEFEWPEVSDDESSTTQTTDDQDPPSSSHARTGSVKHVSSSSFSSISTQSQSSPPLNCVGGSNGGGGAEGSTRDILLLRNLVSAAASVTAPANCYGTGAGAGPSSSEASDDGEESDEDHDHARSTGGFFSCMPILSRVRFIQRQLDTNESPAAVINFSRQLRPGSRNRGYGFSL